METLPKLPKLPTGKLPAGYHACTACGSVIIASRFSSDPERRQPIASFKIDGCRDCGHVMHRSEPYALRDLTRAEAAELAASQDFPRVLKISREATYRLWG